MWNSGNHVAKLVFGILLLCVHALGFAQQGDRNSPERAQQVLKALSAAYPGSVQKVEFYNGDWTVMVWGIRYYYCGGRLLPEELLDKAENYGPQPFYNYVAELPAWKAPSAEDAERFKTMAENRRRNPIKRSTLFFDTLWQARTREEAGRRVKPLKFLGFSVQVHETIHGELALVEKQILAAAKLDPQVRAWVDGINTVEGWNWRGVIDTQIRSFHAYGAAIDILPKSLGGKETYWIWASRNKPEWWNIPYSDRFHPPSAVIKAFESRGFLWGGKWLFFDTMHFEYRPEILLLSEMTIR